MHSQVLLPLCGIHFLRDSIATKKDQPEFVLHAAQIWPLSPGFDRQHLLVGFLRARYRPTNFPSEWMTYITIWLSYFKNDTAFCLQRECQHDLVHTGRKKLIGGLLHVQRYHWSKLGGCHNLPGHSRYTVEALLSLALSLNACLVRQAKINYSDTVSLYPSTHE